MYLQGLRMRRRGGHVPVPLGLVVLDKDGLAADLDGLHDSVDDSLLGLVGHLVEKEEGETRHRGNQEGHTRYRRSYPPRGGEWHRPRGCSRPWWGRRRAYGWRRRPTSDRKGEGRT